MSENVHIPEIDQPAGPIEQAGLLGRLIDRAGIVFALGILASVAILINEVFLRYVFNAPTIWAHETTIFLCGIAFIFGGLYCTAHDKHIRVVLLYDLLGAKMRRGFDVAISLICAAASVMFAWAAWQMVARAAFRPDGSIRIERSGSAWDPIYPGTLKIFMLIILTVMALQFLVLAYNYAKGRR